jgi:hypothetical protein
LISPVNRITATGSFAWWMLTSISILISTDLF